MRPAGRSAASGATVEASRRPLPGRSTRGAVLAAALVAIPWARTAPALEWTFEEGLEGWTTAMTTPVEVQDGALRFRAAGSDPILLGPPIRLETSPRDVVEVRLRSSVSGAAEVFWRHDAEGPYGGFSQGLSRSVEVRRGPEAQVLRLRPWWHARGPILGIRFDPPGGDGDFAVESIRIVEGGTREAVRPDFEFEEAARGSSAEGEGPAAGGEPRDPALGWETDPPGAARPGPAGLRVESRGAPIVLVSPPLCAEAGEAPLLEIDLTAPSAAARPGALEASVEFATLEETGSSSWPARLAAGRRGRHRIALSGSPAWTGTVAVLVLRLPEETAGGYVLHGIRLRGREEGGAAGLAGAEGGAADAEALVPTGLEFQTTPVVDDLRLPVPPERIDVSKRAPPETRPAETDWTVGMWYFAAWEPEYTWDGWKPLADRAPWRVPLLYDGSDAAVEHGGIRFHRSSDPRVIDWHVHWMREHAIRLVLWDWYPRTAADGAFDPSFFGNRALEVGFLGKAALGGPAVPTNRFAGKIDFAVMWTNHPPFDRLGEGMAAYVADQFLSQPNYFRLDGRALIVLWSPRTLVDAAGGEAGARARIRALREEARRRAAVELYIAGIVAPSEAPLVRALGLDGAMGYHYAGSGGHRAASRVAGGRLVEDRVEDYASQTIPGHERIWTELAEALGRDYLVATTPMQNWEPTLRPVSYVQRGTHPDAYREMLRRARRLIEARGLRKVVTVEAWNEWLEGSYVEPSTQWGLGWLEAIRDAFSR